MSAGERRARESQEIRITATPANSGGMPISSYAGGVLMLDSTSTNAAVTLHWYVRESPSGEAAYQLRDAAGSPIATVCGPMQAVAVPEAAFGSRWVMPVISTAGTAEGRFTLKG